VNSISLTSQFWFNVLTPKVTIMVGKKAEIDARAQFAPK
jgi:hypothetical protein